MFGVRWLLSPFVLPIIAFFFFGSYNAYGTYQLVPSQKPRGFVETLFIRLTQTSTNQ